jgi:hypothetical protein
VVVLAVVVITVGYLAIGVAGYDYARWIANWAVCMMLVMLATHMLPSVAPTPPIAADGTGNLVLGWTVTAIPRVGVTVPF